MIRLRIRWRAWLIYVHRWLGIAGCLLFLAWFLSGIVMMYARMPEVTPAERLARAQTLDLATARLTPAEAVRAAGIASPAGLRVEMLEARPVYRFGSGRTWTTVFADTGETVRGLDATRATALAARWAPEHARTLRYDARLTEPDQWTLQARPYLPLHRIALEDEAGSELYVSERTGEIVMDTTRRERILGYLGPVTHWLYLPVLRRNGPLWTQVVIWASGIGCVMCVAGLLLGLLRFSPSARFRLKRESSHTPYAGMMKWHHYAGLIFGLVTFTWTFSGLLSMGPWDWQGDRGSTQTPRRALAGDPGALTTSIDAITLPNLQASVSAFARVFKPAELALTMFRGEAFWQADALTRGLANGVTDGIADRVGEGARLHRLVSATQPERGAFERFDDVVMEQAARAALPGAAIADAVWLREYDAYYYDRRGERPLPVLRVRYADAQRTWLYLDPRRGTIALASGPGGRLNRWLYNGLHSLDFPFLYRQRPLWDLVVIALSLGGIALGATTLTPAWRRLRRHAIRWAGRLTALLAALLAHAPIGWRRRPSSSARPSSRLSSCPIRPAAAAASNPAADPRTDSD